MNLYAHQSAFLNKRVNKTALIWSCGTGKTRAACEWLKQEGGSNLIICPKALKTNWKRELSLWQSHAYVLTKEEFRRQYKNLPKYTQIIVDEVHNGFLTPHFKSQMSKALRNYIRVHQVPRILLLSATVYSSSPWNIYNLCFLLGYKLNWKLFNIQFFNQVRMGMRIIPVPKKGIEKKLAAIVKKVADVVDIQDIMDVPLQHHASPEYFSLTPQQERVIKTHYDPVPIVRFTRQHEIEQGILNKKEFTPAQVFPCDKNDRILALCEENPKIALICRYNAQIDFLSRLLTPSYSLSIVRGATKDRDSVCRAAEAAKRAVVVIQADCGLGFELPSFPICVFVSMSFSYVSWEQTCGRFLRMNNPSRTTFLYLFTDGDSMDKAVWDAVSNKKDFDIELYAKRN